MGGSGTSVAVYDLTAKRSVYQLRPDVLRLPASNEKLVTSSTALASWTATFRFSTQLFIDAPGPDADGVVRGDVYLRGLGDPTLSTASFQSSHYRMETGDIHDFVAGLQDARRDAHHRPRRGRRRLLRRGAQRGDLAAEHDRLLRSALGAHAQRELREQRRLRRRPGAGRRRRADEAAPRRRHPRGRTRLPAASRRSRRRWRTPSAPPAGPRARGDEQAERQLPCRGAAQGPRRRVRQRRHHRRRRRRRRAVPADHRRGRRLPHP